MTNDQLLVLRLTELKINACNDYMLLRNANTKISHLNKVWKFTDEFGELDHFVK